MPTFSQVGVSATQKVLIWDWWGVFSPLQNQLEYYTSAFSQGKSHSERVAKLKILQDFLACNGSTVAVPGFALLPLSVRLALRVQAWEMLSASHTAL